MVVDEVRSAQSARQAAAQSRLPSTIPRIPNAPHGRSETTLALVQKLC